MIRHEYLICLPMNLYCNIFIHFHIIVRKTKYEIKFSRIIPYPNYIFYSFNSTSILTYIHSLHIVSYSWTISRKAWKNGYRVILNKSLGKPLELGTRSASQKFKTSQELGLGILYISIPFVGLIIVCFVLFFCEFHNSHIILGW